MKTYIVGLGSLFLILSQLCLIFYGLDILSFRVEDD